ncbi:MAG TPA: RNA methyltransferase [Caulobacteraceae bacterium]|nr:RNA methyltransferase [Caulobacteraceae bacterium]
MALADRAHRREVTATGFGAGGVARIDDSADPRLEPYLAVRERDLVGRRGEFIAEGEVVLRVLLRAARPQVRSLLVAQNRLERVTALIAEDPDPPPIYVASQLVMDAVVGFHIHRGMLAHGVRPSDPGAGALLSRLGDRALVVCLLGIANHDNMGGLFRNAAAFGADAVLLDAGCCDPLYRKAIRVSVGATLSVPFARTPNGGDMLAVLGHAGFAALALSPDGAMTLSAVRRSPRTAVLFGAEGPGLSADLRSQARTVSIPMAAGWDSLNVAAASAVVLHHLATQ